MKKQTIDDSGEINPHKTYITESKCKGNEHVIVE